MSHGVDVGITGPKNLGRLTPAPLRWDVAGPLETRFSLPNLVKTFGRIYEGTNGKIHKAYARHEPVLCKFYQKQKHLGLVQAGSSDVHGTQRTLTDVH